MTTPYEFFQARTHKRVDEIPAIEKELEEILAAPIPKKGKVIHNISHYAFEADADTLGAFHTLTIPELEKRIGYLSALAIEDAKNFKLITREGFKGVSLPGETQAEAILGIVQNRAIREWTKALDDHRELLALIQKEA